MHDQILSWVMIGSLCQCSSEFTDSVALLTPYVLGYLGADFKLRLGCGWNPQLEDYAGTAAKKGKK